MTFETGTCGYTIKWIVTTYTSGNELQGPAVHYGEFVTERDAKQALADDGFTNGQWGWRKANTDAAITRRVEYDFK